MSSLAAWVAVDSRGPSSFYIASDSRVTWGTSNAAWDSGRKVFASASSSDIFGYCGDVLFPSLVLGQIEMLLARGVPFTGEQDVIERHQTVRGMIAESFDLYPRESRQPFTILHAARGGSGIPATFHLWKLDWSQAGGWRDLKSEVPTESVLVLAVGSGAQVVERSEQEWRQRLGRTSRSVFGSFCDALKNGGDPLTGGPPQLVGLYRNFPGRVFGIVHEGKRFISGMNVPDARTLDVLEWRNELFERCDVHTLERLHGAQRQPRPWRPGT
jgi:hypothetical protein